MADQGNRLLDAAGLPLEGELATRPGEHRYWTVSYFPVIAADGAVQAISAASLEITQQKNAQLALTQSDKLAVVGRLVECPALFVPVEMRQTGT